MRLRDLLNYKQIIIQCHDNPDADAIASGFGVYMYLKKMGIEVRLIYGGRFQIRKANLVKMIAELSIPIDYVEQLDAPKLLLCVDCQYGGGNVTHFMAGKTAVIDHHQIEMKPGELWEIRSAYGSCSTIVWDMLQEERFPVNGYESLATALYYGLYMDTGQFSDIYHPMDRDMRDALFINKKKFIHFRNSNLSREELRIAGEALMEHTYLPEEHFSIVRVHRCDPNILGVISDFMLQADGVDCCVAFNELQDGFKLSVRSCTRSVRANDLASFFAMGIGSGGGHLDKAGGYISKRLFSKTYPRIKMADYLSRRMKGYGQSYETIVAGKWTHLLTSLEHFKRVDVILGAVRLDRYYPIGRQLLVRTMDEDIEVTVLKGIYLMLDDSGRIYTMSRESFKGRFTPINEPYHVQSGYIPSIHDRKTKKVRKITDFTMQYKLQQEIQADAVRLQKRVKLFREGMEEEYLFGNQGDYLVIWGSNQEHITIIKQERFEKEYEKRR